MLPNCGFNSLIRLTVLPYFRAMEESVSPGFTSCERNFSLSLFSSGLGTFVLLLRLTSFEIWGVVSGFPLLLLDELFTGGRYAGREWMTMLSLLLFVASASFGF